MEGWALLVAALTILVTVLIGWQIYTVINIHTERKILRQEAEEIRRDMSSQIAEVLKQSYVTQAAIAGDMAMYYLGLQNDFKFTNYMLTAAMYNLKYGNMEYAQTNIDAVLEYGENGIQITEQQKSLLLNLYYNTIRQHCDVETNAGLERVLLGYGQAPAKGFGPS